MKNLLVALLICFSACKSSNVEPTVEPTVTPIASVTPSPTVPPVTGFLVTYDERSGIEKDFALPALALMNKCYQSGKLRTLWLTHKFVSFNCVFDKCPKTNEEAYNEYVKNAPYALNLRWYYTRYSIIGYTYNFYDDSEESWSSQKSEYRIFSNHNAIAYWNSRDTAAHWAHELAHQSRAGGYVHYTIHDGSTPYEAGDIMSECLK